VRIGSMSMAAKDRPDVAAWRAMLYANDRLLKRLADEMLREQGLELSWYEVLMHLAEARRAITQRELVELTLMGQSGLSRVLAKLEAAGFVRRVAVETDRRNLFVELTDRGRERLRRAAPLHLEGIKRWFADPMTARQVEAIRVGLERVLHNLAEDGRGPRPVPEPVAIGPQLLSLSTDAVLTADAIVVRDALEPLMLADAVRYARPDDVGELRRLLSVMTRRLDSPVEFLRADWALHRRIAQISPNEVLRQVYLSLVATLEDNVDAIVPDKSHPDYLQRRLQLHADIVEAIADSDAAAVAELVDRHRLTTAVDAAQATRGGVKARRQSTR
jgi:DNA-binding MarR family transcriptional regulator